MRAICIICSGDGQPVASSADVEDAAAAGVDAALRLDGDDRGDGHRLRLRGERDWLAVDEVVHRDAVD